MFNVRLTANELRNRYLIIYSDDENYIEHTLKKATLSETIDKAKVIILTHNNSKASANVVDPNTAEVLVIVEYEEDDDQEWAVWEEEHTDWDEEEYVLWDDVPEDEEDYGHDDDEDNDWVIFYNSMR